MIWVMSDLKLQVTKTYFSIMQQSKLNFKISSNISFCSICNCGDTPEDDRVHDSDYHEAFKKMNYVKFGQMKVDQELNWDLEYGGIVKLI